MINLTINNKFLFTIVIYNFLLLKLVVSKTFSCSNFFFIICGTLIVNSIYLSKLHKFLLLQVVKSQDMLGR